MLKFFAFASVTSASLMATSAQARRRGAGGGGEDMFPWLTELVVYIVLAMVALAVAGALWRYFTRPTVADLARERSRRRRSGRDTTARRR